MNTKVPTFGDQPIYPTQCCPRDHNHDRLDLALAIEELGFLQVLKDPNDPQHPRVAVIPGRSEDAITNLHWFECPRYELRVELLKIVNGAHKFNACQPQTTFQNQVGYVLQFAQQLNLAQDYKMLEVWLRRTLELIEKRDG